LEREPPLLMATAFAWGAMVATTTAMPGNRAMLDCWRRRPRLTSPPRGDRPSSARSSRNC
jgi:hypothetical protein